MFLELIIIKIIFINEIIAMSLFSVLINLYYILLRYLLIFL